MLRLATGGVDGVGLDVAVTLVGRRQRDPVRGGVDESLFVDAVRDDQQVIGAGQIPVDARALCQIGVPRFLDVGVAPAFSFPQPGSDAGKKSQYFIASPSTA